MSKRSKVMTDSLRSEVANELGIADKVKGKDFGDVSSKDCGNMVRKAIEIAGRNVGKQ